MKRSIGSYFLFAALLMGCGVNSNKPEPDYKAMLELSSGETLTDVAQKIVLDQSMPEGLGLMLSKRKDGLSTCTALMITDTHAITNSRCVPVVPRGFSCESLMGMFVKTKNGQEIRTCRNVVSLSRVKRGAYIDPDFAVIELSSPILGLPIPKISREGIADKEELTIDTVSTSQLPTGQYLAEYKRSVCVAHTDSLIGNFSERKSTIIPLFPKEDAIIPCHAVGGNSGSPIMNSKGQVVAVMLASKQEHLFVAPKNANSNDEISDYVIATNLSCIKTGLKHLDLDIEPSCVQLRKDEVKFKERLVTKVNDEAKRFLVEEVEKLTSVLPSSFRYDIKQTDDLITISPLCVNSLNSWKKNDRKKIENSGFLGRNKSYQTELPQYRVSFQHSLDKYARLSIKPVAENISTLVVALPELHKILKNGKGQLHSREASQEEKESKMTEISLCDEIKVESADKEASEEKVYTESGVETNLVTAE